MPVVLPSPEEWFRRQGKDLYVFEYVGDHTDDFEDDESAQAQYRRDVGRLKEWFAAHLSGIQIKIFSPSEYSGWIEGGPCDVAAELDDLALVVLKVAWSHAGLPWQIEVLSYSRWLESVLSCRLLSTPLKVPEAARWWDAPSGIILMSATAEGHLLSPGDAWWRLVQLLPKLGNIQSGSFPHGTYHPLKKQWSKIEIGCKTFASQTWTAREFEHDTNRISRLYEALGISSDDKVDIGIDDF